MKPYLLFPTALFLILAGAASLLAQEPEPAPTPTGPEKNAYVRGWAVLGDMTSPDTYSLIDEPMKGKVEEKDQKRIFSQVKGCRRTGFGMEYTQTTAGKRKFVLVRDAPSPVKVAEVEAEFEKGAAYTLIAVLDNGVPKLTLRQESPLVSEAKGVCVYNLLTETPLQIQIGDNAPRPVPFAGGSPYVLPAAQVAGKTVTLIYLTKKRGEIRQEIPYDGNGRLSLVFMRNNSSRPSVFLYPSEPPKEATSNE